MEIVAALSISVQWYVSVGAVYLVGCWLLTYMKFKAKPHRDSLLSIGVAAVALQVAKQMRDDPMVYGLLFLAGIAATAAIMVAGSVASKAKARAAIN